MKLGRFITHPEYEGQKYGNPWSNMTFNSFEQDLVPGNGILNLKYEFDILPERYLRRAVLRATALGIFDIYLNGARVNITRDSEGRETEHELCPGWTDYRARVFEFEFDISDMLAEHNVLVCEVSPGWWSGRISFGYYGCKAPAFAGELELIYADGEHEIIASGDDWQAAICGPVMRADIWDGEYYDATVPEPSIYPEAHEWKDAVEFRGFEGEIVPFEGAPICVAREHSRSPRSAQLYAGKRDDGSELGAINVKASYIGDECASMTLMPDEGLILDYGQELVGRPMLAVAAPRGTRITAYFAEMKNDSGETSRGNDGPKGSLYLKNYRSALARMVYVASGRGVEIFFPTHTFYGFRYIELRADRPTTVLRVDAEVITSRLLPTGSLTTDHPTVNALISNIEWGMRGNYLSIPTDCPQRDERLGWTGDTQIFSGAASYMADIREFMHKWMGDARHSQIDEGGAYCDVIPRIFKGSNNGNAAWGDAGLIVPYRVWLMYGDRDIIEENYDSMESYMEYLSRFGLEGPNTAYGDWLNYEKTDKRYIAVAYYAHDAELMEKFSHILGKREREEHYRELRERITGHFRERYIKDGALTVATQTGYLLALAFGLVPVELRDSFVAALERKIADNGYMLSTGFVGTGILNQTLSEVGLDKLAYTLLLCEDDPSWLYSVRQGATTVWERWNSYTIKRGFGDVGMNSFNHYAYGAVAEWMYSSMCGIKPTEEHPGFERFKLCPTPDMRARDEIPCGQRRINSACATFDSVRGRITSAWERDESAGTLCYRFSFDGERCAEVSLVSKSDVISINGIELTLEELGGRRMGERVEFTLTDGDYKIIIKE